ncbi:HAD-IA family hydrolase [Gallaecimonas sp. GXIMD4217]|uniref:HAD-IA family hydrolase n=1 Tax=Gallaecimonas sp. GXIMD4217 TaxID=3131927 RepID=UPI00311AC1E4
MKIYRPLGPIAALSLDLDDTLYDNGPVLEAAEGKLVAWLEERVKPITDSRRYFAQWRQRVIQEDPWLAHDTTASRHAALSAGLKAIGVANAAGLADGAMARFLEWRSQASIGPETHELLTYLSSRKPLICISNGNADIQALGLGQYFQASFHAGGSRRMKPAPDLYRAAAEHLKLTPAAILHVGDRLDHDVAGALEAGLQSAWFNTKGDDIRHQARGQLLPHVEISALASLKQLL